VPKLGARGCWLTRDSRRDSRELVAELEFVWDQIKNNSASSSNSSPPRGGAYSGSGRRFARPMAGTEGPMKVLSPMSQDDEADREHVKRLVEGEGDSDDEEQDEKESKHWKSKVESTLVKMTAEMAALREQIATGREWRNRRRRTIGAWLGWLLYVAIRQVIVDGFVLALVLLWMRKKKDRRLEDIVREYIRMGRDYIRRYLPSR